MIYFIQYGKDDFIKIGYTENNVLDRMQALQTSSPYKLNLLGVIEGDELTEKSLHEKFKKYHIRGEWFKSGKELLQFIDQRSFEYKGYKKITDGTINRDNLLFEGTLNEILQHAEIDLIKRALKNTKSQTMAAEGLGISFRSIRYKIQKYGIEKP